MAILMLGKGIQQEEAESLTQSPPSYLRRQELVCTYLLVEVVDVGQVKTHVHTKGGRGKVQLHVRVVRVPVLGHFHPGTCIVSDGRRPWACSQKEQLIKEENLVGEGGKKDGNNKKGG